MESNDSPEIPDRGETSEISVRVEQRQREMWSSRQKKQGSGSRTLQKCRQQKRGNKSDDNNTTQIGTSFYHFFTKQFKAKVEAMMPAADW